MQEEYNKLLTTQEIALYSRCSTSTISTLNKKRILPHILQVGNTKYYTIRQAQELRTIKKKSKHRKKILTIWCRHTKSRLSVYKAAKSISKQYPIQAATIKKHYTPSIITRQGVGLYNLRDLPL